MSLAPAQSSLSFLRNPDVRSNDLARHASLGDVDEAILSERVHLDRQLLRQVPHGLLARQPVPSDDGRRVDLVLDEIVRALEELGGDEDDRGGSVSDLLVLLLSELNEDTASGVVDFDEVEDRGAIVRDRNVLRVNSSAPVLPCATSHLLPFHPCPLAPVLSCTHSDIINHHLVQPRRSKTASNDVGNGNSSCFESSAGASSELMEGRTQHVLLANLGSRHALSSALQSSKLVAPLGELTLLLEKNARAAEGRQRQLRFSMRVSESTHHLRPRVFVEECHSSVPGAGDVERW